MIFSLIKRGLKAGLVVNQPSPTAMATAHTSPGRLLRWLMTWVLLASPQGLKSSRSRSLIVMAVAPLTAQLLVLLTMPLMLLMIMV